MTQDPPHFQLTANSKTGWSADFLITDAGDVAGTCRPSAVCRAVCYACANRQTTLPSLRVRARNTHYLRVTPPVEAAREIDYLLRLHRVPWLRWNGSGDLFAEAVPVINLLVAGHGHEVWVYSRIPEYVNALVTHPKLVVLVSLDAASLELPRQVTHPTVKYSWLQTSDDEAIPEAVVDGTGRRQPIAVIFSTSRLFRHRPRTCPVDAGRMPRVGHRGGGACGECRWCALPAETTRRLLLREREDAGAQAAD